MNIQQLFTTLSTGLLGLILGVSLTACQAPQPQAQSGLIENPDPITVPPTSPPDEALRQAGELLKPIPAEKTDEQTATDTPVPAGSLPDNPASLNPTESPQPTEKSLPPEHVRETRTQEIQRIQGSNSQRQTQFNEQ